MTYFAVIPMSIVLDLLRKRRNAFRRLKSSTDTIFEQELKFPLHEHIKIIWPWFKCQMRNTVCREATMPHYPLYPSLPRSPDQLPIVLRSLTVIHLFALKANRALTYTVWFNWCLCRLGAGGSSLNRLLNFASAPGFVS
jgi:hypothetical protein